MGPDSGISGVQGIHRFSHQSGRDERSGALSTTRFNGFSARVFLDMSQEALILNIIRLLGQNWVWGRGLDGAKSSRWSDVMVVQTAMVVL